MKGLGKLGGPAAMASFMSNTAHTNSTPATEIFLGKAEIEKIFTWLMLQLFIAEVELLRLSKDCSIAAGLGDWRIFAISFAFIAAPSV